VAGFQRMFEGRHPNTGELLGRAYGKGAVPAFDVVLRPTKSVSVLFGLGDPVTGRTVLAAHHAGVREAVAYLDEHLGARRGHGGVQHVSGQGLLAVGLDHRTSREGDPLLHTHLVVANRVQGPDGRWTALDGRDLYRHRLAAAAIYRAIYQRELSRSLGVEWTAADAHGNRELAGMPEALVRSYSKRSGQIDVELDRLAADGRERTLRLVKWAVQATRKPKQHEAPDTLYGRWRREAAERGQDSDTLVRTVTGRTANRGQDRTVSTEVASRLFDRLAGPDGLTATASTFARQDVIAAIGGHLAGATRAELEELADRFCAERTVAVVADRALEERRWSTPELLAVEQRLVAAATDRVGEQTAVVGHDAVRAALAAHPTAGEDQAGMVRDLCQGSAGVALVVGKAGTGKTFALGMARHAWQLDGYRPLATAPTGIATVSLEAEGFEEVATCDRLLADLDQGGSGWTTGRCWWWTRPACWAAASSLASLSRPSRHRPRWCWSAMTGSWPPSTPVAAFAPSACGWAPLNLRRTGGSSRPGSARPWSWSAPGWWRRRWPPTGRMTGSSVRSPSRPPPWPCSPTGGRPGRTPNATRART
jgi:conjugative relaxase-like TrwC/TraI family protein